jgi:methylamine dehydrogenase heavy chain
MRAITTTLLCLAIAIPAAHAQISPQTVQPSETMQEPGVNWFMSVTRNAGYIFDASTGDMHGLISISRQTAAVQPSTARKEFYHAASFYSRESYGERTELLVIHDFDNLSPVAEVAIPAKTAILPFRQYIGMMSGGNLVGVSNLTPAQSVSIVDVANRRFVGEVSTPGCSLILPVQNDDFLTICGDGTLMLIGLDAGGQETNRVRGEKFFELQEDPVYDRPVPTNDGWLLFSHGGKAFNVAAAGDQIRISRPWDLVTEEEREEGWWPGGNQLAAYSISRCTRVSGIRITSPAVKSGYSVRRANAGLHGSSSRRPS